MSKLTITRALPSWCVHFVVFLFMIYGQWALCSLYSWPIEGRLRVIVICSWGQDIKLISNYIISPVRSDNQMFNGITVGTGETHELLSVRVRLLFKKNRKAFPFSSCLIQGALRGSCQLSWKGTNAWIINLNFHSVVSSLRQPHYIQEAAFSARIAFSH